MQEAPSSLSTSLPIAGAQAIPVTIQITVFQLWVHVRITWGSFLKKDYSGPTPGILAELLWGGAWTLLVWKAP